jgi:hypothetical protein
MPRAFNLLRRDPHYRRDAFDAGLRAAGYDILHERQIGTPKPSDVLVIWNRYAHYDVMAQRFEAVGAAVIICENGLIGKSENAYAKQFTSDSQTPDTQLYTLSLNYHNGGGRWYVGEPGRWGQQGIEVKPWRDEDDDGRGCVLLLEQRGFGHPKVAPPPNWTAKTIAWLKTRTHRRIRVRAHPGNEPARVSLAEDLQDCWCVATHGSGAAIKALVAGVPAYSTWSKWVVFPGALPLEAIGRGDEPHWWQGLPLTRDAARRVMLDSLGWYQHTVSEIASGGPFKRLMELHKEKARAA